MHLEVQSANTVGEVSTNEVTSPLKLFRRNTPLPPLLPLPCMPQTYIGDSGPLSDSSESSPPQKPVVKRKRCETEEDYADEQQENKRPNSRNSSSSRASVSPNHSDSENTPSFHRRKARTAFSSYQIETLNNAYNENKYQATADRRDLAKRLGLSDQQVKNWFQNRRVKDKRQEKEEALRRGVRMSMGGVDMSRMPVFTPPFMQQPLMPRLSPNSSFDTTTNMNFSLPSTTVQPTKQSPDSSSDKDVTKPQLPLPFQPSLPAFPHFFPGYPFMPGFTYPSPFMNGFGYPPFVNTPQFGHCPTPAAYPPLDLKLSSPSE